MQLCFHDIVIDTNVLLHATGIVDCSDSAFEFIQNLLISNTLLCVDKGFDTDKGRNKSIIGWEYLEKLRVGTFGYSAVCKLADDKRIVEINKIVSPKAKKIINNNIKDPHDRIFIEIACNSDNKQLVSHDFVHFDKGKRAAFKGKLKINIACSAQLLGPMPCVTNCTR